MFVPWRSETGVVVASFAPRDVARAEVWLVLVPPASLDPERVAREDFLRELIRTPAQLTSGSCTVHVPVGRDVGLAIVVLPVAEPIAIEIADAPSTFREPVRQPLPVTHSSVELDAAFPKPRAPAVKGPTGFGVRQRWTLTRLRFAASEERPRALVRRTTFIGEAELGAWGAELPADAVALPSECDGVIDGATPDEAMAFYAVLEGPAPWRSIPLFPDPPPFRGITRPFVLGDAAGRLAAVARRVTELEGPMAELLEAAREALP